MNYQVVPCSPKAQAKIESFEDSIGVETVAPHYRCKYPFHLLNIGQCFIVPIEDANDISIRNSAVADSKKTGKKYTVIRHKKHGCIEVARIA